MPPESLREILRTVITLSQLLLAYAAVSALIAIVSTSLLLRFAGRVDAASFSPGGGEQRGSLY